jgi:hypothetical protein
MSWLFFPGCPVLAIQSWLFCPCCSVLAFLYFQSSSGCPILGVLIWLTTYVLDRKKSDVSGSMRSVKCAVVFNVLCKRSQCTVELCPAWAIWSRDLTSSTKGTRPLPYLPGHWKFSLLAALNKDGSGQCGGQPNPESAATGQCMYILFLIYHLVTLSFGTFPQMVYSICMVLIVVIFFWVWLTKSWNKELPRAFITLSWAVSRTTYATPFPMWVPSPSSWPPPALPQLL